MLRSLQDKVSPEHAALLIVDMQNDFLHKEGVRAKQGKDVSLGHKMVPRLVSLLSQARKRNVFTIFIRMTSNEWTMSPVSKERTLRAHPEKPEPVCREGSWGADFYEVAPLPGEPVVTKHRYSAFVGTELDVVLRSTGIKTLILTGVATNVCVESTARDGFMRDYYVVFVSDCTAAERIEDHEATLRNIEKFFGVVTTSEELIALWNRTKPG